ncbi:MAG: hypothetical protein ABIP03_02205 [Aquihabitans sp.]
MSPDLDPPADAPSTPAPSSHPGPPSAAARNLVVGLLIAFVVASNLGNLFLSVLVTERPLLFIALNAQNRNLALAAGELSAWSFYVVGFLRLVGPDPLFFLLGRWYGDSAIRWMERKAPSYGELLRHLEKGFGKARLLVVAFAPNNPICLFAGAAGMSWGSFALANAFGTAVRLMLIRAFSEMFEGQLGSLKSFIADYRLPLLAVSFVLVGLTLWSDRRGGREGIGDLVNLDDDILDDIAAVDADHAPAPVTPSEPEAN